MGEKFIIQGGYNTKVRQISMGKDSMFGQPTGIQPAQVKTIGDSLGVDWNTITLDQLFQGTKLEAEEHVDVVGSNTERAVRIAYAHLKELPDYYARLKIMEHESEIPNTDANIRNADEVVKGGPGSGKKPTGLKEINTSMKDAYKKLGQDKNAIIRYATLRGQGQSHEDAVFNTKLEQTHKVPWHTLSPEVVAREKAGVRQLPKTKIGNKDFYIDERLSQIREVNNPHSYENVSPEVIAHLLSRAK